MIQALLQGNLSRSQVSEDLLTSTVFGLLRYIPDEVGLIPFLAKAKTEDDRSPLDCLTHGALREGDVEFWPSYGDKERIPDAVVHFRLPSGEKLVIAIEAKLGSSKSPAAPIPGFRSEDQLAGQWQMLKRKAPTARCVVVYLTAHVGIPSADLDNSARSVPELRPNLAWLSWRALHDVLTAMGQRGKVEEDLLALLDRMDLRSYSLRLPYRVVSGTWKYRAFCWMTSKCASLEWTYGAFCWMKYKSINLEWRFR